MSQLIQEKSTHLDFDYNHNIKHNLKVRRSTGQTNLLSKIFVIVFFSFNMTLIYQDNILDFELPFICNCYTNF